LQKLGKYEILAELGHGAMGVVYKARDPFIGRLVALKTINSSLVDRPDLLERFRQEAQSAGKLQHPNIVTIFELGQEKDTPYIAMEYLDGESLEKTILRQDDLPLALKVGFIVRICQALEYAHKNRVVHRDIKPGNIMVNFEGVVKVVDFGIARLVDFSRTHTNMMIGTPSYMAPELFRKKKADERTDIWAAGITFYELICYQRPFNGEGYDIIRGIMEDELPSISTAVPDCPPEVVTVIERMLRKQSTERYQSMEDVLQDLEPVYNRLRSEAAAVLAARGRELFDLGELPKAQEALRRARLIDNTNVLAKSLLEKISAQFRRIELEPKIQERLNRGRAFLQAGQFREAQAQVEAALELDSRCEPAQKLGAEVEAAAARAHQLKQKLRFTKQRLAEGALTEAATALQQALDLDATHPQALELKRQLAEEKSRRERRKQLSEVAQRARTLWTELKYEECLAMISEGLKSFPNEPELKKLQEAVLADVAEQRKQAQTAEVRKLLGQQRLAEARRALDALIREQPGDSTVRNLNALLMQEEQEQKRKTRLKDELARLRALVSDGKLKDAIAKGEPLLREFPREHEIKDLVAYAKEEITQQEQKKNELEREKQVQALLVAQRFREAGDAARRAGQEFPSQSVFRRLAAEADQKAAEQHERERKQKEVQQRVQDIRNKIKRQELSEAIQLAEQTLIQGPNADITQLLQAAKVELEQRDLRRTERNQQLEAAQALFAKGDLTGARQLLDRAMAAKVLESGDKQAKALLVQISEKEEALRKTSQKLGKPESTRTPPPEQKPPGGSRSTSPEPPRIPAGAVPRGEGPDVSESAASIVSAGPRSTPSIPVMTPPPAAPPPVIQTQLVIEERIPEIPKSRASGGLARKPVVLVLLGLILVGGLFAAGHFIAKKPSGPSAADLALEAEAKQLWDNHKPNDALADWQKLAGHPGPLHDEAVRQANDIEQKHVAVEQLYAQGMKLLYEDKKYPEAAEKFNEILQMNLWKMDETRHEYDIASKGPGGPTAEPAWQTLFDSGLQAFAKKDYATAQKDMEQAAGTDGVSSDMTQQVVRYLAILHDREEQKRTFDQATQLARTGQKQQAQAEFERVVKAPNGDPELVALARNQINLISHPPKPTVNIGLVIADVRNFISQARWDDAEAKLSAVPSGNPDYADLKRQIDAGRREDRDYVQAKDSFNIAHTNKHKDVLRALRPFFLSTANKPGPHSGEARNIVEQIDADLKAPDGGGVSPNATTAAAIKNILDRYAKAIDDGDIDALRGVRRYTPKEESKLAKSLKSTKGKGYVLRNCALTGLNGDAASVSCDAVLTKVNDGKSQRVNLELNRIGGNWIIVSSN
jgi:eukaryotic-like serine/threonine-protein kinase